MKKFALDSGFAAYFGASGADMSVALERAGLPCDLFKNPRPKVSAEAWASFMTQALKLQGGGRGMLDLICNPSDSAFSPPVAAAWCSRNGAASIARLAKYKELIASEKLTITKEPSALCATFSGLWEGGEPSPELGAAEFIFLASLMRKAADPVIRPLGASVRGGFNDEVVARYLVCRIEDGERCAICFSKADMAKPFSNWSPRIWDNLSPVLESRLGKAQGTFSSGVVHALQSMLPAGECGIADAASRL